MNIYYKITLLAILFYTFMKLIKENTETYENSFSLPKVKTTQLQQEQLNNADQFSIKQTIKSGIGVHDRIRYQGDWN